MPETISEKIEELTGVTIYAVSLGASREKILFLSDLFSKHPKLIELVFP